MPARRPVVIDLGGARIRLQSSPLRLSERDIIYEVYGCPVAEVSNKIAPADVKLFTVPTHHIQKYWQTSGRVPLAQAPLGAIAETLPARNLAALILLVETIEPAFVPPIRAAVHVSPSIACSNHEIWIHASPTAGLGHLTRPSFCAWLNLDNIFHPATITCLRESGTASHRDVPHLRLEIGPGEGVIWEPCKLGVFQGHSDALVPLTKLLLVSARDQTPT